MAPFPNGKNPSCSTEGAEAHPPHPGFWPGEGSRSRDAESGGGGRGDLDTTEGAVRAEEEQLPSDDPRVLLSKAVSCNQVIYGVIDAPDAVSADGSPTPLENVPFMAYFKRSGFRPVREFIDTQLTRRKILMQKAVIELTTEKQKNGGVIYWTPKLSLVKEVSITDDDKDLIKQFAETVKGHNDSVMSEYKAAVKMTLTDEDLDLAQRFAS